MLFDVEADGLLEEATKIHVLSFWNAETSAVESTFDYDRMRELFLGAEWLEGHNIVTYDIPLVEKLLGIDLSDKYVIDTLPLSWYLNHHLRLHGLEAYGDKYKMPKLEIDDWKNLTPEQYQARCERDVEINKRLSKELKSKLDKLYGKDQWHHVTQYLSWKMTCLEDQEEYGIRLDVDNAVKLRDKLEKEKREKEHNLREAMPEKIITQKKTRPKVMYKKDGTLSSHGTRWMALLEEYKMPRASTEITVIAGREQGNPSSNPQLKDWLFSLGWKPETFKFERGEGWGEERKIPQIKKDSELCPSVVKLIEVEPAIELLDGLTVITHRLGIVKAFLEHQKDGRLVAGAHGLTNTFRFRHKNPLVNLPGVDKPYGAEIRGLLLADEGSEHVGCDMVSLEDTTKRHYIQPHDPDYVEEMEQEGFDSHLDLAKHAGKVTQEQIDAHNEGKVNLKGIRKNFKAANYACVYGVKETTLSRQTGLKKAEAAELIEAYWERNWAVKLVADRARVRELFGSKWVLNEVSGIWHSLRAEKDRWSTINQSTGVWVFDNFVMEVQEEDERIVAQFHDEILVDTKDSEATKQALDRAEFRLNEKLQLNVPIKIDYSVGMSYADVH